MKGEAPNMSSKEMAQIRQNLEGTPDIEEAAELMNLAGNSTRLKLLYLLENMKELCVCDLAATPRPSITGSPITRSTPSCGTTSSSSSRCRTGRRPARMVTEQECVEQAAARVERA